MMIQSILSLLALFGSELASSNPLPVDDAIDSRAVFSESWQSARREIWAPSTSQAKRDLLRRQIRFPQEPSTLRRLANLELGANSPSRAIEFILQIPKAAQSHPAAKRLLGRSYFHKAIKDRAEATSSSQVIEYALRDSISIFQDLRSHHPSSSVDLDLARGYLEFGSLDEAKALALPLSESSDVARSASLLLGLIDLSRYRQRRQEGELPEDLKTLFEQGEEHLRVALQPSKQIDGYFSDQEIQLQSLQGLGDFQLWSGGFAQAASQYQSALELDPGRHEVFSQLLEAVYLSQEQLKLIDVLEAVVNNTRSHPNPKARVVPLLYYGEALLDARKYGAASTVFSQILGTDARLSAMAQLYYALSTHGDNEYQKAREELIDMTRNGRGYLAQMGREFSVEKRLVPLLRFHTNQLVKAKKLAEARDLLIELVEFDEQDPQLLNNIGFLCRETQQYEDALSYYLRGLALDDEDPRLLNDTAVILHYYLKRDFERAKDWYQRSITQSEKWLGDPSTRPPQRQLAKEALKDARENLTKLEKLMRESK